MQVSLLSAQVEKLSKGATKHCCWGLCTSDSRYPERLPPGVFFFKISKVGNIKDSMTKCEKLQQSLRTDKCKIWLHACGRKFFPTYKVKKDTYICSLHFIGGKGPSEENPHPICASHSKDQLEKNNKRKRKLPIIRNNVSKLKSLHRVDFIVENDNNNINSF